MDSVFAINAKRHREYKSKVGNPGENDPDTVSPLTAYCQGSWQKLALFDPYDDKRHEDRSNGNDLAPSAPPYTSAGSREQNRNERGNKPNP